MKLNGVIPLLCIALLTSCNSEKKETNSNTTSSQKFASGKQVYDDFCITCHMPNGKGVSNAFPPLDNSDYLKEKRTESIRAIKYGLKGKITVNGKTYNSAMTKQGLTDEEITDVMNYITNSWTNKNKSLITIDEVSKVQP
jgi:mono/diheme cytochrome c family protein